MESKAARSLRMAHTISNVAGDVGAKTERARIHKILDDEEARLNTEVRVATAKDEPLTVIELTGSLATVRKIREMIKC
jgi:hypothetical protein